MNDAVKNIAIFASGNGTNAENIIRRINSDPQCGLKVALVVTNRADAQVVERARRLGVEAVVLTRDTIRDEATLLGLMDSHHVDAIVLAGFLLLIPGFLLHRYPRRVINIHPSLLPRHGGRGMYGHRVHQAVIESGDAETGITIHLVDEEYDRGEILFQATTPVDPGADTAESVEARVRALEIAHYPEVIISTLR